MNGSGAILGLLGLLMGAAASAQSLRSPEEIVIHIHKDFKNTDFVEGLMCELGRVLRSPVRSTESTLPLTRMDLMTQTQLDAVRVRSRFVQTIQDDRKAFHYLIVPYDLKVAFLNYVFADTELDGEPAAIMSTIRLMPQEPGLSRKRVADVTGDRLYKLMLKSIALLAGLRSQGCIMMFPRSLPELDAKPDRFCPDDHERLVAASILKERQTGACNEVAAAPR